MIELSQFEDFESIVAVKQIIKENGIEYRTRSFTKGTSAREILQWAGSYPGNLILAVDEASIIKTKKEEQTDLPF